MAAIETKPKIAEIAGPAGDEGPKLVLARPAVAAYLAVSIVGPDFITIMTGGQSVPALCDRITI